ncbi:MAG: hypothetical protein ACC641_01185 [Acidiferrobacterales bacterium]
MAKYILADSANHTRRGNRIFPGHSTFSSQTSNNIVAQNAPEIGGSALVAIMLNPWHAQLETPKMLELHFTSIAIDTSDPTIRMSVREVTLPEITTDQKIIFGLMVVSTVFNNNQFNQWAEKWIDGSDRSAESAGRFIGYLGKYAKETRAITDSLIAMGIRASELEKFGGENNDFCVRASEAVFAAQMYVDRADSWPLLASRSVSSAVTGLGTRTDLAAIAEKAIDAASHTVMRTRTAA